MKNIIITSFFAILSSNHLLIKIPKGIYIMAFDNKEFNDDRLVDLQWLKGPGIGFVFIFDGKSFIASGGPFTAKPSKNPRPYNEIILCGGKNKFCVNPKINPKSKFYLVLEKIETNRLVFKEFDKDNMQFLGITYMYRINDVKVAKEYFESMGFDILMPGKNVNSLGYSKH